MLLTCFFSHSARCVMAPNLTSCGIASCRPFPYKFNLRIPSSQVISLGSELTSKSWTFGDSRFKTRNQPEGRSQCPQLSSIEKFTHLCLIGGHPRRTGVGVEPWLPRLLIEHSFSYESRQSINLVTEQSDLKSR